MNRPRERGRSTTPGGADERCSRRRLLRATGAGLPVLWVGAANAGAAQEGDAAVLFADQTSDGVAIRIAAVRTAIDVTYTVSSQETDRILAEGIFNAGTRRLNVTIRLDERIERSQTLSISLFRPDGDAPLTSDTAEVSVLGDTSGQTIGNATDGQASNETTNEETAGDNATAAEVVEGDERDAEAQSASSPRSQAHEDADGAETDADGERALGDEESDTDGQDPDTAESDDAEENDTGPSGSETPGFGVGTALASLGGLAYALDRFVGGDAAEQSSASPASQAQQDADERNSSSPRSQAQQDADE